MDELAEFNAFIAGLEAQAGAVPVRRLTEAEQTLAAFGRVMSDGAADGMGNVVWSAPEQARRYADAIEAIGASEIAQEMRSIAAQDAYSGYARRRLFTLNDRVQAEWQSLWRMALAYAKQHGVFPRQDER